MISEIHIRHLEQCVADAEQEVRLAQQRLDGWRTLLADARARAGVPADLPPRPPYGDPAPMAVLPAQAQPGPEWDPSLDPKAEQAHQRFQAAHDKAVCGDTGGNKRGGVSCALEPGHEGDHDDMLGTRWPREERRA